jgi:RimJ/RimL family protein N-acetyltransferase
MIPAPRVHVAPVSPASADAVRALRAAPAQQAYVGDTAFNLADAQADPRSEAMAVLADDRVVGFYRIDLAPTIVSHHALGTTCAGLRAMLIDRGCQGSGLGRRALLACCDDLQRRHPHLRLLALNVDCGNRQALRAYRNAGFVDSGELHAGGRAGPQHLMLRRLGPVPAEAPVGE